MVRRAEVTPDNEALKLTSEKLNVSEKAILEAIRIESAYGKIHQGLKDRRKAERHQRETQIALEKEKQERPDLCFCEEEGFTVKRQYEEDGIIEYFTTHGKYDFYHEHPYQEPLYRCSRCGKKYMRLIAMA